MKFQLCQKFSTMSVPNTTALSPVFVEIFSFVLEQNVGETQGQTDWPCHWCNKKLKG